MNEDRIMGKALLVGAAIALGFSTIPLPQKNTSQSPVPIRQERTLESKLQIGLGDFFRLPGTDWDIFYKGLNENYLLFEEAQKIGYSRKIYLQTFYELREGKLIFSNVRTNSGTYADFEYHILEATPHSLTLSQTK